MNTAFPQCPSFLCFNVWEEWAVFFAASIAAKLQLLLCLLMYGIILLIVYIIISPSVKNTPGL